MIGTMTKAPADVLDFEIDFSRWLPMGDIIVSATATVEAGAVALDQTDHSETQVRVWLSGGAQGDAGPVTVTAVTQGGRTKAECFRIRVDRC